jgi:hypothetical protein
MESFLSVLILFKLNHTFIYFVVYRSLSHAFIKWNSAARSPQFNVICQGIYKHSLGIQDHHNLIVYQLHMFLEKLYLNNNLRYSWI